jgi:hypothetical protein
MYLPGLNAPNDDLEWLSEKSLSGLWSVDFGCATLQYQARCVAFWQGASSLTWECDRIRLDYENELVHSKHGAPDADPEVQGKARISP